ncbi:MAG: fructoselysine 6-kinase [Cellvibrionaceae bacterium]|jgi:fructoselysine 6-kinase
MKIVSVGEITIDYYLKQNSIFVGGISLNFAVNAKRSGAEAASLVSVVGDEPEGHWVLGLLASEQVDYSHVAVLEGKTATCDIEVFSDAERVFPPGGYHEYTLSQLNLTDDVKAFINQHDIVASQYNGDEVGSIVAKILQMPKDGIKRVIDFGDWANGRKKKVPEGIYQQIDLAFFSGDQDTVEQLKPIAQATNCQFVVTMGVGGSVAITADELIWQPALKVDNPVDSTGCGDAFQAAFTVNYFNNQPIQKALEAGAIHASHVLTHYGAFDQPTFAPTSL